MFSDASLNDGVNMATDYKEVYEKFYERITDFDLPSVSEVYREHMLEDYLRSACSSVRRWCKIQIPMNHDEHCFRDDIDEDLQYVLACGMAYFWVNPKVANTENLHNVMNTKDFQSFSPAELLLRMNE